MKKIIGITGLIASGKSTAAEYLKKKYKAKIIGLDKYTDDLYKNKKTINEIAEILQINFKKNINVKKQIADIVFKDTEKLKKIEDYFYKKFNKYVKEEITKRRKIIVIDAAVLFFAKLDKYCDYIIYIKSDKELLFGRKKKFSKADIGKRIKVQEIKFNKIPEKKINFIVENNDKINKLYNQIDEIIKRIKK